MSANMGNPPKLLVRAVYHRVSLDFAQENQSYHWGDSVQNIIQQCDSLQYPFEYGLLYYALFMAKILDDDYATAFNHGIKAVKYMKKAGKEDEIAEVHNSIGQLFKMIGDYNTATDYFEKALKHYQSGGNKRKLLKTKLSLTIVLYLSGEKEKAVHALLSYLPEIKSLNDLYLLTAAYVNLGVYLADSSPEKAFEYYGKALQLTRCIDNDYIKISVFHNIGAYYLRTNLPDSSYKYLKEAEKYYTQYRTGERLMKAYIGLSLSFSQKRQFDSAYYYHVYYDSIHRKLLGSERISLINKTEAKYVLSDYRNKLKIARDEYIIQQKQNTIIIISGIGILSIVILSLIVVLKQKKIVLQQKELKEIENRKLNEKLKEEEKQSQMQKEEFTQKIDSRNREISTSFLLLSNKNLILNKILQLTQNCSIQGSEFGVYKKQVEVLIKENLNVDEDWKYFKIHFEKVHPLFFSKLKQVSGELTENDLRLCAYFKIGMRAKQIAQALSVSPDSIKTSRYRLKKKLNISGEESIDDFLRNL